MFEKLCYGILTLSAVTMALVVLGPSTDETHPPEGGLRPGESVPPLRAEVATGARKGTAVEAVGPEAPGRTLVVFFNTECVYCRESLPTYHKIARRECDLRMAIIVTDRWGDDLSEWWSANAWDPDEACARVLVGSSDEGVGGYGIRVTPTHILIEEGVVVEQSVGALRAPPRWLDGAR